MFFFNKWRGWLLYADVLQGLWIICLTGKFSGKSMTLKFKNNLFFRWDLEMWLFAYWFVKVFFRKISFFLLLLGWFMRDNRVVNVMMFYNMISILNASLEEAILIHLFSEIDKKIFENLKQFLIEWRYSTRSIWNWTFKDTRRFDIKGLLILQLGTLIKKKM